MLQKIELQRFLNPEKPALNIATRDIVSCREGERIGNVIPLMLKGYRRIPVNNRKGLFVGLITNIDVLDFLGAHSKHLIFRKRKNPLDIPVSRMMETDIQALHRKATVRAALDAFKEHGRGAFPIIYRKRVLGILSEWDVVRQLKGPIGLSVGDVMMPKPMIVRETWPVFDVARMMVKSGFRRFPVVKEGILSGIVTPHDILSHLERSDRLHKLRKEATEVRDIMQKNVITLRPDQDLSKAIDIMRSRRTGGLPVTEDAELLGIITERDILDFLV